MAKAAIYGQVIGASLLACLLASTVHLRQAVASERVRFDSAAIKPVLTEFQRRRAEAQVLAQLGSHVQASGTRRA